MNAPKVLIADDHPLFREALRHVCERAFRDAAVMEVAGHAELLAVTGSDGRFDLAIVDLMMPGGDDLTELKLLRTRMPTTPTIIVSSRDDRATVRRTMACGVAGYIPKSLSAAAMEAAIRRVLAGGTYTPERAAAAAVTDAEALTPRQLAVLEALSRGRSNRQIAKDLGIEEITVKVHISAILRKLHVKNRLEAAVAARAF